MQLFKRKLFKSGITTFLISNGKVDDTMEIIKSLEESGLLRKGVSKTIKIWVKEQRGGFTNILLGSLGASLLGNLLTGKGVMGASEVVMRAVEGFIRAGEKAIRVGQNF